jgi:hypothetical protein
LRADDVLLSGRVRPTVLQWIAKGNRKSGDYLFPSRIGKDKPPSPDVPPTMPKSTRMTHRRLVL